MEKYGRIIDGKVYRAGERLPDEPKQPEKFLDAAQGLPTLDEPPVKRNKK